MPNRAEFFDPERREKYKVLALVMVDYLPGDIYAYTDREGWHNIFVKEEFYSRTKSVEVAKRLINQLKRLIQTDYYELKTEAGKKEWDEQQAGIAAQYKVALERVEDLEAQTERAREVVLDLQHDNPFHPVLNPKKGS